jgi:hypothetical protein
VVATVAAATGFGSAGAYFDAGSRFARFIELQVGVPVGAMGAGPQFVPLDHQTLGELRLAAVPPCVAGNPNCYVSVHAVVPWWFGFATVGLPAGLLFFAAFVFFSSRGLSTAAYTSVRKVAITIHFLADGSSTEHWLWDGIHGCASRRLPLRQAFHDPVGGSMPEISRIVVKENPGAVLVPPPVAGPEYHGEIHLPAYQQPPYRVGFEITTKNAWARKASDMPPPPPYEPPGKDYWRLEIKYPIERLEIQLNGFEYLQLTNDPIIALRTRGHGASPEEVPPEHWDSRRRVLSLEDLLTGETLEIQWMLQ